MSHLKKSKTEEEKRVVRQDYDKNKRLSFQNAWLHIPDFKSWLWYDKESKFQPSYGQRKSREEPEESEGEDDQEF